MDNSIEEDRINNAYCFLNSMHSDFRTGLYYKEDLENLEHILSDYKKVLEENEELKQEKINNYRMIVLAQNEALGYMQGYEDGRKLKTSAIASIVENQQYYIIKKQMEKYEEHIEKLQKENEELHKEINERIKLKIENEKIVDTQFLPIQKVKALKQEAQNLIDNSQGCMLEEDLHKEYGKIEACDELLEGRK